MQPLWTPVARYATMPTFPRFMILLFSLLILTPQMSMASTPGEQNADNNGTDEQTQLRQLAQLAEYVGVDYSAAVENGEVVNADEYQEMLEFTSLIIEKLSENPHITEQSPALYRQALALQTSIKNKQDLSIVRQISSALRGTLLTLMPESSLPKHLLSDQDTQNLFQTNCATCHGVEGRGNGILAANLSPEPTDFTDKERAGNRSILGLFDAISNGLDDTAMPPFTQLKEQERWSLAFYVASLAFQGESAKNTAKVVDTVSLQQWVNHSPFQLAQDLSDQGITQTDIEALRANPETLFNHQPSPILITKNLLLSAKQAYDNGDFNQAKTLSVSAYLDGFELIENSLDAHDKNLRKNIEVNLMQLRHLLSNTQNASQLEVAINTTMLQLDQAQKLLTESNLSNATLFSASLIILLREGLEALLVVIALMTVLIRTNRRDALKYLHFGWVAALIAGGATWAAAQTLIDISGASREMMEGFGSLFAALMLFYVGVWMHSKTHAAHWQAYINKKINSQLKAGTLWGIALLSFIAVYREIFETILFYQSLLTQTENSQFSYFIGGLGTGIAILAITTWGLLKYSIKLPLAKFFSITTYLLLILSFILMGKAISALQEAAVVPINALPVHIEMDWIGVGSTWEGISAQLAVLILFIFYMVRTKKKTA
ncbi:cytochrome c/FTR1 family iron permease [Shewanella surugensis]|uniref:Cytochrome c/FTR1 family iron permease n=1 Tax=Shewanella surugensis TaxID=212020 RepID=A0ABT0LGM6_9GAMM|nr:cytochrome c/FTR1 family iron permease [Shewanella surugensis]MCL1126520.1 cytochrome c/FTR1 family iron permease [Shewanella surugensis]